MGRRVAVLVSLLLPASLAFGNAADCYHYIERMPAGSCGQGGLPAQDKECRPFTMRVVYDSGHSIAIGPGDRFPVGCNVDRIETLGTYQDSPTVKHVMQVMSCADGSWLFNVQPTTDGDVVFIVPGGNGGGCGTCYAACGTYPGGGPPGSGGAPVPPDEHPFPEGDDDEDGIPNGCDTDEVICGDADSDGECDHCENGCTPSSPDWPACLEEEDCPPSDPNYPNCDDEDPCPPSDPNYPDCDEDGCDEATECCPGEAGYPDCDDDQPCSDCDPCPKLDTIIGILSGWSETGVPINAGSPTGAPQQAPQVTVDPEVSPYPIGVPDVSWSQSWSAWTLAIPVPGNGTQNYKVGVRPFQDFMQTQLPSSAFEAPLSLLELVRGLFRGLLVAVLTWQFVRKVFLLFTSL